MKNKNLLKILFVEDLPSDAELAVMELRKEGLKFEHKRVDTRDEFIKTLNEFRPNIIISDYSMPTYNGMMALMDTQEYDKLLPFILCTGSINEETAVECIKAGAMDYVIKEHLTRLPFAVKEALEQYRIQIEKRAAELLLKESEEKLQSIFSAAPIGIGLVVNRVLMEVNNTFCKMTGYTRKELIGKSSELIYATKEEFERDGTEKYRQISEKGSGTVETRFKCKNGNILNILLSSAPLDKDDLMKGVTFTAMDITEKMRVEEALRESEEKFRKIFEDHAAVKLLIDPDSGEIIDANKSAADYYGWSCKELKRMKIDQINTLTSDEVKKEMEKVVSQKRTHFEFRHRRNDGSIRDVDVFSSIIKIGNKNVLHSIIHDITEQKQTEDALLESQHLFQTLAQVSPVGIFRTNADGETTYVNPKWSELSGLTLEEAAGLKWLNTVHPDDRERLNENWLSDFTSQKKSSSEYRFLRSDGSIAWVMGNAVPELIDNEIVGYIGTITDITDRKRAEMDLRESEEKFKAIYQNSNDAIMLLNKDGFFDCNPQTLKIFKVNKKEEFIKFLPAELSPPFQPDGKNSFEAAEKNISIAYQEGYNRFDWVHRRVNGEVFYVEVLLSTFDLKGERVLQATVRDITERKRVSEVLKESEEKYHRIFENIQDMYYETTMDGTILEISPAIEILSKGLYHREDLIGNLMINFYSDANERAVLLSNLKERGSVSDFEIMLRNRDGSQIPCSISSKITLDAQGKPEKIIGSVHDITERKQAENALKESEEKFRSTMENSADAIFITDLQGKYTYTNKAVTVLLGYTSQEMMSKTILDIIPSKTEKYIDIFKDALSKGKVFTEIELVKKDGDIISTDLNSVLLPGGLVYASCRDITERKLAQESLKHAFEKAEENDKLKTAFLHNISHEIRTPMNAIVGFSALLGEPDLDVPTQQSYIETITQSSNHLLSIITDIIDISNIEANIVKITRTGINVNFTLKSLCNQFLIKAGEKKIKLVLDTVLSDSEALVITDNTKLTQILTNLLSNAIKFTDEGTVKLSCRKIANFLEFSVSDTGIGIPADYHEKIFDRFYQVQNAVSRLYEGTGLGLAISKAYVDLMGGKIWLSSEAGKGTTFTFTIPYKQQSISAVPVIEKPEYAGLVFPEKKTILVAEDVDSNFKLITYFLSNTNIKLLRASNGKEAVKIALAEKNIDLILMDIKMPEMDGYTAVKLIREANIKIPIIAQTAYADDKERAIECGCSSLISKPFNRKTLLKEISECIGQTSPMTL